MVLDVKEINSEIAALRIRVEELASRIDGLEGRAPLPARVADDDEIELAAGVEQARKGIGEWVSRGALLQRISAICFVMVFALLLRAITDSGYLDLRLGSMLGIGYVSALVAVGWRLYSKEKVLAPVFATFGILLLFSIIIESRMRFETLSSFSALLLLYASLIVSAIIGLKYKTDKLLYIGVIGAVLSTLVIDFPKTFFAGAGPLLILANIAALMADRNKVSIGLKWFVAALTVLFWFLWAFKINALLKQHDHLEKYLYAGFYLPELLGICAIYLTAALRRFFSDEEGGIGVYYTLLPSFTMFLFYLAGRVIVVDFWGSGLTMGVIAITLVVGLFLAGWRLSFREEDKSVGVGALFVAGAVMLAFGLPELTGNVAYAVPLWSLTAYGLAHLSGRGKSGAVRGVSYLYQIYTLVAGFTAGIYSVGDDGFQPASFLAAFSLFVVALMQFRWCRKNPPPPKTLFSWVDSADYSAVSMLIVSLAGCFFIGSMTIDIMAGSILSDSFNVTWCGRSVLINIGAILLMVLGYRKRSLELIWVAVALGILAMLKVFIADLFRTSGIPLVFSVLSFGILAASGSVVLGKWQKNNGSCKTE